MLHIRCSLFFDNAGRRYRQCGGRPVSLHAAWFYGGQHFHPQNWPTLSKGLQIGLKAVSAAALVCMVAGGAFSIRTKMTRSDADYIIEWNGGVMLLEFTSHPEKHEATLREVLARTKNKRLAERVSAALAEIDNNKPTLPANAQ